MAQNPAPTPEELQKETELANKQRDLAKAQKELIDAQNALAAAQRAQTDQAAQLADQVSAANAAKDLATAQKAMAEAQKAKSEAQTAAFKASVGEVPTSGLTGAVTTGAQTGEIEAALLSAHAVREAAATIDALIRSRDLPDKTTIAVLAVSEIPSFQNLIAYQAQREIVRLALNNAIAASQGIPKPAFIKEAAGLPILGGAGLVLDSVSKLLSFFRSDYAVAGVTVEAGDLVAVTEIANLLAQKREVKGKVTEYAVIVPAIYNAKAVADAGGFIITDVAKLSATRQVADSLAKRHDAEVEALAKAAADEKDPATKQQLQQDAGRRKGLADALRAATLMFDTWFSKLSTPDDKGVIALVTIAKEEAIHEQLEQGGKLLLVKVQKAGGGYFTKKNLWTLFGGMPLYHMGGAAVAYALIDGTTGRVGVSGVVPVYGGFVKSNQVRAELAK